MGCELYSLNKHTQPFGVSLTDLCPRTPPCLSRSFHFVHSSYFLSWWYRSWHIHKCTFDTWRWQPSTSLWSIMVAQHYNNSSFTKRAADREWSHATACWLRNLQRRVSNLVTKSQPNHVTVYAGRTDPRLCFALRVPCITKPPSLRCKFAIYRGVNMSSTGTWTRTTTTALPLHLIATNRRDCARTLRYLWTVK